MAGPNVKAGESPFAGAFRPTPGVFGAPKYELRKGRGGHTTASAMQALLSANEPKPGEKETASDQQVSVRTKLENLLAVIDTFLSGSYRRHTQRRPVDDIDLLVLLSAATYLGAAGVTALTPALAKVIVDLVYDTLRAAYPTTTHIVRFNRGVQIKFTGTGISFDIVPTFQFTENEFYIPDTDLSSGYWGWLRTNPKEQERLMREANRQCGRMLVPLVKLLKAWAAEQTPDGLTGFHLEAMAYHALKQEPESYAHGLQSLFSDLSRRVLGTTADIWPQGEAVGRTMTADQRVAASSKFLAASAAAERAIKADEEGRADDAHAEWRSLFGSDYPEAGTPRTTPSLLSGKAALEATRSGARVTATSDGLVAAALGLQFARSGTSHGESDRATHAEEQTEPRLAAEDVARLEHNIAEALGQFTALTRLTPEEAAADPALWPVGPGRRDLYAVLVGEQRTNLGGVHRILVTIPRPTPQREPRIFLLTDGSRRQGMWAGKRRRGQPHRYVDGALCTHADRDQWDGRLVTLLIWAADYLVRYDHFQTTGLWIGREIDGDGKFRMNGRLPRLGTRSRRRA
jgi:hypothetical protein